MPRSKLAHWRHAHALSRASEGSFLDGLKSNYITVDTGVHRVAVMTPGEGTGNARSKDLGGVGALLQAVVESAPTGVILVDQGGRIVLVNREIERLFGYERAELLDEPVEILVPEQLRGGHRDYREEFEARPESRTMGAVRNLAGRRKDGSEIPVEIGLNPIEVGSESYVIASVVDISARREAEKALRERDELFRQLAENIDEVFYVMDIELRETLYISPAYEDVWGRSRASLYENPRSFLDALPDDDRERLIDYVATVRAGQHPGEIEFGVVRPDSEVRWILGRAVAVRNDEGEVYRLAGVALDITERKRAQDALRASERRLRTLFETVNLIVLGLDDRGRINYVNPYFLRLTEYTLEEVIDNDWFELFMPPDRIEEIQGIYQSLLARDEYPHYRNPIVTKDGEQRMISWHNTSVRDGQGRRVGTLSIGEDVTDVIRLEKQFRQAQKMEAVGRLAGGIAHDFNNLLTVISGYGNLLLKTMPAEDRRRRDDLEAILQAADSATALTRQLLMFSRQQAVEPRVLDLNSVVRGAEKMLHRTLGEDIEIASRLAPELGSILADPGQIEQVIMNLAINARDAMPDGGKLTIETSNVELTGRVEWEEPAVAPGPYVQLAVSDTGVGMDEATRSRIFEPFFTTKKAGEGTGLGLSTALFALPAQTS